MTDDMNERDVSELYKFLMQGAPYPVIKKAIPKLTPNKLAYWFERGNKEGWKFARRPMGKPRLSIPKPDTYDV